MLSTEKLKDKLYTDHTSPFERFTAEAQRMVKEQSVVLHGGCGADDSMGLRAVARKTIGIDLDEWIARNTDLDLAVIGELCYMPLRDRSVDIVLARWVLEHMSNPALFFHESARVLRPGGQLLLMTTNQYHYFALAVRMTPLRFQRWFVKNVFGGSPDDVFPTFYRANTSRRLRALATEANLVQERIEMLEGPPSILKFSSITFLAGMAYERIVNRFRFLSGFRGAILTVFRRLE